jgi:hypothetical protein
MITDGAVVRAIRCADAERVLTIASLESDRLAIWKEGGI